MQSVMHQSSDLTDCTSCSGKKAAYGDTENWVITQNEGSILLAMLVSHNVKI